MIIIPAIDIKRGRCVRLTQGDYNKETVYEDNPVKIAEKWKAQGAKILHLIDLDGAKTGKPKNFEIIKNIIEKTNLQVQVGGGIRREESIDTLLNYGISKVILGTLVLENKNLIKKIIKKYQEKIIVSLDVKNNKILTHGWLKNSDKDFIQTAKYLDNLGIQTFIFTDIIRDGTLTEPNYENIKLLLKNVKANVMVAGGVSSIEQIKKLNKIGVYGVIIGKALYEDKIDLRKAIEYVS